MDYIVSARKYRPISFDTVVGQEALTTTLKNAVRSGKLAHAFLFCGPRGVGKTTCARIFARVINCLNPTADGEACNECESCRAFNEQRSYNIFELDAASNNSVENIKQLMDQTRVPPQVGRYKVFIIDEVHMLSTAAFNSFLKTLEEPPSYVIFILATTEKHKILPTILSRCQIYDFERMTVENIVGQLKMIADREGINYEEEALAVIAEKADGGMRDALSIFDQTASFCQGNITYAKVIEDLNVLDTDNYFNLIDQAVDNRVADMMLLVNSILSHGFEGGHLINGLASHVRNVLMAKDEQTIPLLETSKQMAEKYKAQAQKCPVKFLYGALKLLSQCDQAYRQSSNKRLLVELTLIQMGQLTQPDDEPAAGRSPRRLKTLFKKLMTPQPKPALQVAETGREKPVVHVQRMKLSSLGSTFGGMLKNASLAEISAKDTVDQPIAKPIPAEEPKPVVQTPIASQTPQPVQQEAVTVVATPTAVASIKPEELSLQWRSMCIRMQPTMPALAACLKNIEPRIINFPEIEVVADSQWAYEMIQPTVSRIRATMAQKLECPNVQIILRVAKPSEVKPILTSYERFQQMQKDYSPIAQLAKALSLELA